MTNKEKWFDQFDRTKDEFQWFIIQYFGERVWSMLLNARKNENQIGMLHIMNSIWYNLPSDKFNIRENPKGWSEFLALFEE
jgi:hypothetical protein